MLGVAMSRRGTDLGCACRLAGSESVHVESPGGHVSAFAPIAKAALRGCCVVEGPLVRERLAIRGLLVVFGLPIVRMSAVAPRRPCVSLAKEEETFGKVGLSLPTTIAFLNTKPRLSMGILLDPLSVVFCTPCPLIVVLSYVWIPFIMDTVLCSNLGSLFVLIDYHRLSGSVYIGSIRVRGSASGSGECSRGAESIYHLVPV